jgi:small subunit ribosomal protein S1
LEENQIQEQTTQQVSSPHDDFDWSVDKRNVAHYAEGKREELAEMYDSTFKSIDEAQLLHGTIVGLTKTDVIINIGFKSDGLISLN